MREEENTQSIELYSYKHKKMKDGEKITEDWN